MDEQRYYYNRPIGLYVFTGIAALSLIVSISQTGEVTWMNLFVAGLWGLATWALGNIIWALVGDVITPYTYGRTVHTEIQPEEDEEELEEKSKDHNLVLEANIAKRISNNRLWAKGMCTLESYEEEQLERFMRERWNRSFYAVPEYFGESLKEKLHEREIIEENGEITEYGKTVIPSYHELATSGGL